MKIKRIHHVAVICTDYEVSKRFYMQVLGMTLVSEHYRADRDSWKADLSLDGVYQIELFSFPNPPARLSYPEAAGLRHLAFEVDDMDSAVAWLQSKGVGCGPVRVDEYTGKKFLFLADPDNLPIELYEA